MLSMNIVTALFDGNKSEAREVLEGMRTAEYVSPEERQNKPICKRINRYYLKNKKSKSA